MSEDLMFVEFNGCDCMICLVNGTPDWVWFPQWPYVFPEHAWRGY